MSNELEPIKKGLQAKPEQKKEKEDYIDAKITEETTEHTTEKEIKKEVKEVSQRTTTIGAIIAFIILILLLLVVWNGYKHVNPEAGYSTQPAQEVIHNHQNPTLKAEKLNPNVVYELSGASDELNKLKVSIQKVQFRKDQTRLWVKFENSGAETINMMPNANSKLVDNEGHQYKVDPFAGDQITSIASGVSEEAMLVFEPIRAEAKEMTFHLDSVFNMKQPAWNVSITVDIP